MPWWVTLLICVAGLAAVLFAAAVALSARLVVAPGRSPLWSTPAEHGLAYEDVAFAAQDGVRLSGWFVPAGPSAPRPAPAVVLVHGWPWNRMGTQANHRLRDLPGSRPIDLMPVYKALNAAGYAVLSFDMRNHGQSAASRPITSGWLESRDLLGAVAYLVNRSAGGEVDAGRIGALGFSMGGNTVLFALPHAARIRAAVAVQPNTSAVFGRRYRAAVAGPLAGVMGAAVEVLYRLAGGPRTTAIQPILAVAGTRDTPVLYVQGAGDPWGDPDDVRRMVAATPNAVEPLFPPGNHRFDGYDHVVRHPQLVVDFFDEHLRRLPAAASSEATSAAAVAS